MIRIFAKVCAFFCLLTFAAISYGQGGASTGDLHVTVKDPKGNLVGNATVTVRDVAELLGNSEQLVRKHYAAWIPGRQERLTAVFRAAFSEKFRPNFVEMPETGTTSS